MPDDTSPADDMPSEDDLLDAEAEVETPAEDAADSDEISDVGATIAQMGLTRMSLQELKDKAPADLLAFAELFEIENVNSMRKQDIIFAILKTQAEGGV